MVLLLVRCPLCPDMLLVEGGFLGCHRTKNFLGAPWEDEVSWKELFMR